MKLKNIKIFILLILLIVSCSDQQTEIQFKVLAYNSDFSVAYSVDGGSYITERGSDIGSNVYVLEKTTEIDEQIEVNAYPDASADSLTISFYDDGDKVKSCSLASGSTSLTCEFDLNDSTTTK